MSAKRLIYPPHWTLLLLGVQFALNHWLPVRDVIPEPLRWAGIAVIALAVALGAWAAVLFKRSKTGIVPFSESTAVVESGPYRFTRNPMYVGMALILLGAAILMRSLTPLVAPLALVLIIHYRFIVHEEAHMERALGASYLAFKSRVRRWL
jgi:protein-S-isoprenylcysteine O-methyltransferase Ste14